MLDHQTCPHLVLGMRSDEPIERAGEFFARASRRLKQRDSAPYTIQQMTAALAAIESGGGGEYSYFSIPCDSGALTAAESMIVADVQCSSVDDFLKAAGAEVAAQDTEYVAQAFLNRAVEALLEWQFSAANVLAVEVLRLSADERLRDEALNVIAAAKCLLGEHRAALDALQHAVQGQWNVALQVNLALVATDMDPALAVNQMRFIIDAAPDGSQRLEACLRAIGMWRSTQQELTGSDDIDDHEPMPRALLDSIHRTLGSPELSESDFFSVASFLATNDPDYLLASEHFAQSIYRHGVSGRLVALRAGGLFEYLNQIVALRLSDVRPMPWVDEHIEHFVSQINSELSEDGQGYITHLAFSFLEQGLGVETIGRVALRGFLALKVCSKLSEEGDLPSEKFTVWIREARQHLDRLRAIDPTSELIDSLQELIDGAGNLIAAVNHDFYVEASNTGPTLEMMAYGTRGVINRFNGRRDQVQQFARTAHRVAWQGWQSLNDVGDLITDPELLVEVEKLKRSLSNVCQIAERIHK